MRANEGLPGFVARPRLFMRRSDEPEWLDQGRGTRDEVAANLAEMWRINHRLGGLRAITRHLHPRLLASPGAAVTLLDVGTGAADIPAAIGRWAQRRGLPLRIVAVDRVPGHLAHARGRLGTSDSPPVSLVCAEAGRLPLGPASVDFVMSSLLLHHLAPPDLVEALRAAFGRARQGVVMSDLVRGWLPFFAFKLLQPLLARNFLTRHDGLVSIRRAYSPAELLELAGAAGLPNPRVHVHWPWRMTLVADRG